MRLTHSSPCAKICGATTSRGFAWRRLSRRRFLGAAAAAAAFTVLPGRRGHLHAAPADGGGKRKVIIGLGRGLGFIRDDVVAVCDVDRQRLAKGVEKSQGRAQGYTDFRRILDRPDIDEVQVVTPPHWHALISVMAAQAGKSVFCEKPLTRTIAEGRALLRTLEQYRVPFRYGAHIEGTPAEYLRRAVQSGALGSPLTVYQAQSLGCNFKVASWRGMPQLEPQPVPAHLDWNMYVGPAPLKPYHPHRTHGSFRGYWDYDGGGLADMAPHVLNDIIAAMGKEHTGPVEIWADAPPAHPEAVGVWYKVWLRYADGTTLVLDSGMGADAHPVKDGKGLFVEGPQGRLYLDKDGLPATDPPALLDDLRHFQPRPNTSALAHLPESLRIATHAHRVNSISILANIAIRVGRKVRFDPATEQAVGDDEANRLVAQPMRAPWDLTI